MGCLHEERGYVYAWIIAHDGGLWNNFYAPVNVYPHYPSWAAQGKTRGGCHLPR